MYITFTLTALGRGKKKRIDRSISNKKEKETKATVM
jgi:hypothetical protein